MRQHSIDLLPEAIRIRSEAGIRSGRSITAVVAAVIAVVLLATQSRFELEHVRAALLVAEKQADHVLMTEATAKELTDMLQQANQEIDRYDRIAYPVKISSVVATVINRLPASITLDRLDIDAGARVRARSARRRGPNALDEPRRTLNGDLSGLAPSDEEVAELVGALDQLGLFEEVRLKFSRSRKVRGHAAREFRLSFRLNLENKYQLDGPVPPEAPAEVAHVE